MKIGKYGVIDETGKIIISPIYNMLNIPNPSKDVFICYTKYDTANSVYEAQVKNKENNNILTDYEEVLPIAFKEATSQIPFEKSVLKAKLNGKYGIIDFTGEVIIEPQYDEIESLLYREGTLLVKKDNKYGLVTIEGKTIIEPSYDVIEADGYYNETSTKYMKAGFIVGNKTDEGYRYGYINAKGKMLLDLEYSEINRENTIIDDENVYLYALKNGRISLYKNQEQITTNTYEDIEYNKITNLFSIQRAAKQGVIDINGNNVIEAKYESVVFSGKIIKAQIGDNIEFFDIHGNKQELDYSNLIYTDNENYIITVDSQGKYGVINKENETIIRNTYQYIEYAFNDYFIVTSEGKVGILDGKGTVIIDLQYNVIQKVKDTNMLQAIMLDTNTIHIYNNQINKTYEIANAAIYVESNYVKVASQVDMKYFNYDGNIISNKTIFTSNKLFASSKDGKWGFVDNFDNVKVEQIYDLVTEFNQYGFAGVKQGDKWGVVDENGNIIVQPTYNQITEINPQFIGKYCRANYGYGYEYYTADLISE